MSRYVEVLLPSPPFAVLTYEVPSYFPNLAAGSRVLVPMRRSTRVGVVTGACDKPSFATKPLLWPLDRVPLLDADYLDLAANLASRQMAEPGKILGMLLPSGLRTIDMTFSLTEGPFPAVIKPRDIGKYTEDQRRELMRLWLSGVMRVRINPAREAEETVVRLAADPPWAVRPNAKRQLAVLEYLLEHGPTSRKVLDTALGPHIGQVLKRLQAGSQIALGRLELQPQSVCESAAPTSLTNTPEQAEALQILRAELEVEEGRSVLLHGVTGSGKTHVYLELAADCLAQGKQVLLLAPEVALACALFKAVKERFSNVRTILYHGYQGQGQRRDAFTALADGDPAIVVGTRSALFLPLRNLGLVILDEEHDESFKQEERLVYQAKEVAWFRVQRAGALLVLGSATPDAKTFRAAQHGGIPLISLTKRVGDRDLPTVKLADISMMKDPEKPLAPEVLSELEAALERGEQAVIMLNRRGYAPLMYCMDCGDVVRCAECHVALTYHKRRERLVCHYCGFSHPYPVRCAGCGGGNHLPMGEGTERLEESLTKMLPEGTTVLRMDRDTTRRQERLEQILDDFAMGRAQVLVGTQMLSKGHHFPGVSLVVVADGDLGLNLPDYRSAERTFQLLVQVAGRAGRGATSGKVYIQTRNPSHPFWAHVLRGDYEAFYAQEIARREQFGYPPFVRLGLIRLSVPGDAERIGALVTEASKVLQEAARKAEVSVLGPAPAPLSMLRGRRRFNCLVKGTNWPKVREVFARIAAWNPDPERIRIRLDLDPLNML